VRVWITTLSYVTLMEAQMIDGATMLKSVNEAIEEKNKRVERLHEELEICRILIQDKMTEAVQLLEELSLLQNFSKE